MLCHLGKILKKQIHISPTNNLKNMVITDKEWYNITIIYTLNGLNCHGIACNGLQIGGRFNAANVLLALVALRGIRNNLKTIKWN